VRKPLVSLLVGVFVVMALALALGRLPVIATPQVDAADTGTPTPWTPPDTPTITPTPADTPTPTITPTLEPSSGTFHLDIDADAANGNGPCDPVDAEAYQVSGTHYVAVCMESAPQPVGFFEFDLVYDDTLNQAPEIDCPSVPCLDDNPDANAGSTLGSGTPTSPDLGGGWDCSAGGVNQPRGDIDPIPGDGIGVAHLSCTSVVGPYTSPVNDADPWPLAVITFNVQALGTDTLTIANGLLAHTDATEMGSCNPAVDYPMDCIGASNYKTLVTPTATSTPTDTPTPTITPTPTDTSTPTPTPTCAASPTVNLAGWWGYVYAMGATTYGECTAELYQEDGDCNLTTTTDGKFQCGGARDGVLHGSVTDCTAAGCTVTGSVAFGYPGSLTVYLQGITDGSTQSGNWGGESSKPNTYVASLAEHTDASHLTVTVNSGGRTIDVTFDQVTGEGETAVISDSSAEGPLPGQFRLLGQYFHVMTNATGWGQIEVCASYEDDPNPVPDIFHYDADKREFVLITDSNPDHKVCGHVTKLSEFALVVPSAGPVGGIGELPDTAGASGQEAGVPPDNSNWSAGGDMALAGGLAAAAIAIVGGWYARRRWLR
jgi:hypothetical protein